MADLNMGKCAMPGSGYADRPDYRVDLLARRNRVRVLLHGVALADSRRPIVVDEQDHGLVVYLPPDDIDWDKIVIMPGKTSFCPYKGVATYLAAAETPGTAIAWRYEAPFPQVARITNHVAFYQERVDLLLGSM
jgi:uncharacterized protein (DUF427 family)